MREHLELTVKLITFRPGPAGVGIIGEASIIGPDYVQRPFVRPGAASSPALEKLCGKTGFALLGEIRDMADPDGPLYTFCFSHLHPPADVKAGAGFRTEAGQP